MLLADLFSVVLGDRRGGGARATVSDETVARLREHLSLGERRAGDTLTVLMDTYDVVDLAGVRSDVQQRGVRRSEDDGLLLAYLYELGDGVAQHLDDRAQVGRAPARLISVDRALYREIVGVAARLVLAPPLMMVREN